MAKKDTLTNQDKKFAKIVADTGNRTKAAKEAYGIIDDNVAAVTGHRAVRNVKIQEAIVSIADSLLDEDLIRKHKELLNSTRIDHMVFPLGPKGEDDDLFSGGRPDKDTTPETDGNLKAERTTLTDKEIIEMLAEVNCKVRRIVHGESARHVYFWAADNMARDKALDKAYKLKGTYAPEKSESKVVIESITQEEKEALLALIGK